ncbi:MAG: hypothetical protein FWE96_08025, partial [Coriobacteriia bacterium]|nr:hypothetical protein [Coriobacteriia bacterium]
ESAGDGESDSLSRLSCLAQEGRGLVSHSGTEGRGYCTNFFKIGTVTPSLCTTVGHQTPSLLCQTAEPAE